MIIRKTVKFHRKFLRDIADITIFKKEYMDSIERWENDGKDLFQVGYKNQPSKTLKFLGYITDYTENYDSGWGDVKYVGRAESFYVFNSFKRTINIGFNVPCFSKKELETKHCALSELASVLAGKYSNGLLGGIITKLKLGGYVSNQPGIINNLTFSPIQDSSWDLDAGLAFYLKVSFGFTVIHNFIPQYNPNCGFLKDPSPNKIDPPPKPPVPDPVPPTPAPSLANNYGPLPIVTADSTLARLSGQAGVLQGQQTPMADPITARGLRTNPTLFSSNPAVAKPYTPPPTTGVRFGAGSDAALNRLLATGVGG